MVCPMFPQPKHFRSSLEDGGTCWNALAPGFICGGSSRCIPELFVGDVSTLFCAAIEFARISLTRLLAICLDNCCRATGFIIISPITGSKLYAL